MMTYDNPVRTLQSNNEMTKRIHRGIFGSFDPVKVHEALPDKIIGRFLNISSNGWMKKTDTINAQTQMIITEMNIAYESSFQSIFIWS
jgi:hypothetical protein